MLLANSLNLPEEFRPQKKSQDNLNEQPLSMLSEKKSPAIQEIKSYDFKSSLMKDIVDHQYYPCSSQKSDLVE